MAIGNRLPSTLVAALTSISLAKASFNCTPPQQAIKQLNAYLVYHAAEGNSDNADWIGCAGASTAGRRLAPSILSGCRLIFAQGGAMASEPKWAAKPKLAAELLGDLRQRGYDHPASAIVRDFNLDDPELLFYITDLDDQKEIQSCHVNAFGTPHCEWHLFGQASVRKLEDSVKQLPYVILGIPRHSPR